MIRVRGFTLVEAVVAITIIGVVSTIIMTAMGAQAGRSADRMVAAQATEVAEFYFTEVMANAYAGPNTGGRDNFDDVLDYNNYSEMGVHDRSGTPIAGLGQFNVAISVTQVNWGVPAVPARLVTVRVTDPLNRQTVISGYRTNHP